jgi:hypothetical protein
MIAASPDRRPAAVHPESIARAASAATMALTNGYFF